MPFTGVRSSWVTLATNSDLTLAACLASSRTCSISLPRCSCSRISLAMQTKMPLSGSRRNLASTGKQVRFLRYITRWGLSSPSGMPDTLPGNLKTPGNTSPICLPRRPSSAPSGAYPSLLLAAALA